MTDKLKCNENCPYCDSSEVHEPKVMTDQPLWYCPSCDKNFIKREIVILDSCRYPGHILEVFVSSFDRHGHFICDDMYHVAAENAGEAHTQILRLLASGWTPDTYPYDQYQEGDSFHIEVKGPEGMNCPSMIVTAGKIEEMLNKQGEKR